MVFAGFDGPAQGAEPSKRPNIVFIMADDQGYGDAKCNNPECGYPTPGIDRIATQGMRFTDAHSGSAVCTPTRYGLLTGRYAWRTRLQRGVLGGITRDGFAPLISPDTLTVGQFLKNNGYRTACVGKWHLGFRYELPSGKESRKVPELGNKVAVPVGAKLAGGPTTRGFDHFWGFHHAAEMCTWIDEDQVTANIRTVEMLPRITNRALAFLRSHAEKANGQPFFLYVPLSAPHGPIVPTPAWKGKSKLNDYADFVMQVDDSVGQILNQVDELGFASNTMVVFTADNGCSPIANLKELKSRGHDPMAGLRGHKADIWEGGHRVPYVVRWPGVVAPGTVSQDPICLNSLLATCADILQRPIPEDAGVDSFSIFPLLQGASRDKPTHPVIVHHSSQGKFAVRKGDWKYLACSGSGGWSKGGDRESAQLYNVSKDLGEKKNQIDSHPSKRREMMALLEKVVREGRTTPGAVQPNDVKIDPWKGSPSQVDDSRLKNSPIE